MSTDTYRRCAKCGATPIKDGLVSFHRFPKPGKTNVERARAWAMYCWPEEDWASVDALTQLFNKNKVLCNRHFEEYCFTDSSKRQLGRFSVPVDRNITESMGTSRSEMNFIEQNHDSLKFQDISTQSEKFLKEKHDHCLEIDLQLEPQVFSKTSISDCQPGSSSETVTTVQFIPSISKTTKKTKGILKSLNMKRLNELTPREKKLYKICGQSLKEISRLRKELKSKKKSLRLEKICEDKNVKKLLDLKLSNPFIVLLQSQLQNCKKVLKARRFNVEQKIMALTLYKKSPACYRLLRRMFALPCQSTLKKMLNRLPLQTGINSQVFEGLKNMAETQLSEENLCILSFDEMAIRKHLYYNEKSDVIEGFQDHGNHERTNYIACNALVFMLTGVRKKWKQPIAFYFSGKSVTSDRLSVIIKEILHECWKTGLTVVATVCDLSRVNIKALDNLGSSKEEPYFTNEGREIVTILDPPHLLKCTRNMFLKHDVEVPTVNIQADGKSVKGVAKWSHVQKFYDLDKNNPNFVFAPALTEQHLKPNSKQKMRVKLAAQVFSHKVTAGILNKIATNELPTEAHATATLLCKFDQLFDALNADSPDLRGGKKYSTNMSTRSPHLDLFKEMRKFISEMNFRGSNSPPPSQMGWIRTLNAVERLWKNLQSLGVKTLSTRRLNQDPLENCFGCIRYHCGSNDNPNVGQFIAGIKTAIMNNLRHSSSKRNCEDDNAILSDNLKKFLLSIESPSEEECDIEISIDLEPLIADATEAVWQASPEVQACAYVCGYIFKKLKHNTCENCKKIFLASETAATYDNINLFTNFREYDTMHNSLYYVTKDFVHCVEVCSSAVNLLLNAEAWKKGLKKNIISALSQVDFGFLENCPQHFNANKKHIIISTFYICTKRYIVLKNREFGEEERKRSLQRKMKILRNK